MLTPDEELDYCEAGSSVKRGHAQKFISSMIERKRTKSAVWEEPPA